MLTKVDSAQMNRPYLEWLSHQSLIDVAYNLRNCAVTLSERLEQNSENSSKPPSSDNPCHKNPKKRKASDKDGKNSTSEDTDVTGASSADKPSASDSIGPERKSGNLPGAQGFWRSEPPGKMCGRRQWVDSTWRNSPLYGVLCFRTFENGFRNTDILYATPFLYSHLWLRTRKQNAPGERFISTVEGRKKDLWLTEYVMVGPMSATFIAALSARYRMSRLDTGCPA